MQKTTNSCSTPVLPHFQIISRVIFAVIGLLSNSLLLVRLIKDPLKCFRNSSSYFVTNLCISDILTSLTVIAITFWRNSCIDGVRVYIFFRVPLYISFSSILTMAFDRYISSCHPLKYKIFITKTFTKCLILLQWLFYIVESIFELFYEKCFFYPTYILGICIVLSSVIMYAKAAYVLKKNSKYLRSIMDQPSSVFRHQEVRLLNEKRFLSTIFMVSCISVATFCPLIIYDSINGEPYYLNYAKPWSFIGIIKWGLFTLFFLNFWINPFVYTWRLTSTEKLFR